MDNLQPLTDGERRLLEAVRASELCDLSQEEDSHRIVRAAVLKAILSGEGEARGIGAGTAIELSGAVVSGVLGGFRGNQLPPTQSTSCRFEDSVDFRGATFNGGAGFDNATFTGDALFRGATFTGTASFCGATFAADAWFGEGPFTGDWFGGATFTNDAWFDNATFTGDAWFGGATSTTYGGATFNGGAGFDNVTFAGDAGFGGATFTGTASFENATFTGDAWFDGALAHRLNFSRALFSTPDPGPWIASEISLDRTTLASRSRISITATEINASRLQAREGAHLVLHCKRVDLGDSEFVRPSIVSSAVVSEIMMPSVAHTPQVEALSTAKAEANKFRDDLKSELAGLPHRCCLTSLARANIGDLALSDLVLDDCTFAGAHGLDKLRIGAGCSFRQTPRWWGRRRMVRRRVIAEELQWRKAHIRRRGKNTDREFLPAVEIAGIYRGLRKGLEDAKNEPGAADFYYGEMEMRRLAGRKPTDAASKSRGPSWAERILLYGYWAVSGYGLRASRALLTLVAVIAGAAMLYTMPAFATVTPPPAQILMINPSSGAVTYAPPTELTSPQFWTALEYSARESTSLLQAHGLPAIDTTGAGTILDFVLRLAGPLLLAFAILALRARTKR